MTFDAANLSPHFTLAEMTVTSTTKDVPNRPDSTQVVHLIDLCESILEPVRAKFGPLKINSGFRSCEVNKLLSGASASSQHMRGEAADFRPIHYEGQLADTLYEICQWIILEGLPFDQLIFERGLQSWWIHVSHVAGAGNRRQAMTCDARRPAGKRFQIWGKEV